jgi:hypothetical protein
MKTVIVAVKAEMKAVHQRSIHAVGVLLRIGGTKKEKAEAGRHCSAIQELEGELEEFNNGRVM